jgi:hypothetical protein
MYRKFPIKLLKLLLVLRKAMLASSVLVRLHMLKMVRVAFGWFELHGQLPGGSVGTLYAGASKCVNT